MSYLPGGETEKLGNNYEDNVLIYYYGQVMKGNYLAVMSEAFNKDLEQGGDIYLYDYENRVTVVQVKSRNGNKNDWDIKSLIDKNIIKNACHHICNGNKFVLASTLSCAFLQDLIKHAAAFNNYDDFFKAVQTKSTLNDLLALEYEINKYLNEQDVITFYHNFSLQHYYDNLDDFIMRFQICVNAMDGGQKAFQLLRHYAIQKNKLSKKIYSNELWQYLTQNGIRKYIIDEPAASRQIVDLCAEYKDNIKHRLINNRIYPRKEFDVLKDKINDENIVVVHGKAGTGKSGVILHLCNYFDENGILYLPISLDAHLPGNNTYEFGKQLLLNASPVDILSKLGNDRQTYLILDQLDAIRWNVTHATSAFGVCRNLVKEAQYHNNVKIIFACRTIDADKVLHFWDKDPPKLSDCSVEVQMLSEEDIHAIVGDNVYSTISPGVREMLKNINSLSMFLALKENTIIHKSSDIIREYINKKLAEATDTEHSEKELRESIDFLVDKMRINSTQFILTDDFINKYGNTVLERLLLSGLLEKASSKIKFSHQSILDFYFAQCLAKDYSNKKDIINAIKRYNHTAVKDYEVLKQFFEFIETNDADYIPLIDAVLFNPMISSFIKHIALESFRTTSHHDAMAISLALKILTSKEYGKKYAYYIAYGNAAFLHAYVDSDVFANLQQSSLNEDATIVVDFLLLASHDDTQYLDKLKEYIKLIQDKADVLTHLFFQIDDKQSSNDHFNLKLDLLNIITLPNAHIDWDNILSLSPDRAGCYIDLLLRRDVEYECRVDWNRNKDLLENVVKSNTSLYCEIAKKYLKANCSEWELGGADIFEFHYTKNLAKHVLLAALKFETNDTIINFLESPHALFNNFALSCIVNKDFAQAINVVNWIIDNNYLSSLDFFYHNHQLALFIDIIVIFVNKLNKERLSMLIEQIKKYRSPHLLEFAKIRIQEHKDGYFYHFFEEEQRLLLCSIPVELLDGATKNYANYLLRKFPQPEYYARMREDPRFIVRSVVSGIDKKCFKFSYKTWKQILTNPKTGQGKHSHEEIDNEGNYVEYGRDDFSRAISMMASARQTLFVKLALNLNKIPRDFIDSICSGLSENANNIKQRYPTLPDVSVCDVNLRLQVFKKFFDLSNKRFLYSFISFVENTELMDEWIEHKLIEIAKNPQLYETEKMNVWRSGWNNNLSTLSANELETEKINRVQTRAITVLANILFKTKHLNSYMREILEECYNAEHPVLLFSAVDIIYPIWNFDKQFTMDYLIRILEKDIRVIRGRNTCILLDHIVVQHSDLFYRIFNNAINSGDEYLSSIGERIIYYYCFYNTYHDLVASIKKAKPDMVVDCCLKVINDTFEPGKQDRAKKLLLSISEKRLRANYYPRLTDVLLNNKNKEFSHKLIKKLKHLPHHEWYMLLSDINKIPKLYNYRNIIFKLSDIVIAQNNLSSYEAIDFIGILVRLFIELYDKNDYDNYVLCHKKIDLLYDNYTIDASYVMSKI